MPVFFCLVFMELDLSSAAFWIAVGQIILIDIVLSGDNAVVIALACRNLSPEQRKTGIFWGVAGAISLRVVLTVFAALVMNLPWLKMVGGLLLIWIAVKLMLPEDEEGHDIEASANLWGAVKTIVVADFVMSLDNVIGVAGAAQGSLVLLLFGLAVSIPLIVWSSQVILRWMERWPWIVLLGAGLLGYVAGQMIFTDPGIVGLLQPLPAWSAKAAGAIGALLVVIVGRWLEQRILARQDVTIV
ncbi:MAG TPA: TerC family protein [Azonexus sp.]|jgi:YjbE family integral membrane protein|nr:TerC family protein [Azonexus sp.]